MNCPNCLLNYNDSERTPRLLIGCGHSICEKCTSELYKESFIICPECTFMNIAPMITCFPRNLALIAANKKSSSF